MQNGKWGDDEIIPSSWVEKATKPSQTLNPEYGFTFWVNTHGTRWPGLPKDMFSLEGYNSNRCYVIPSKEVVVVRVGSGPNQWNEQAFYSIRFLRPLTNYGFTITDHWIKLLKS